MSSVSHFSELLNTVSCGNFWICSWLGRSVDSLSTPFAPSIWSRHSLVGLSSSPVGSVGHPLGVGEFVGVKKTLHSWCQKCQKKEPHVSFRDGEMFWNYVEVTIVQLWEYTKRHWTVHLKLLSFVIHSTVHGVGHLPTHLIPSCPLVLRTCKDQLTFSLAVPRPWVLWPSQIHLALVCEMRQWYNFHLTLWECCCVPILSSSLTSKKK